MDEQTGAREERTHLLSSRNGIGIQVPLISKSWNSNQTKGEARIREVRTKEVRIAKSGGRKGGDHRSRCEHQTGDLAKEDGVRG